VRGQVTVRRFENSDLAEWSRSFGQELGGHDGEASTVNVFHALTGFSRFLESQRELACRGIFLGNRLIGKLLVRSLSKKVVSLEIWFLNEELRRDFEAMGKCVCVEAARREWGISRFTMEIKVAFPAIGQLDRG
jgi:hypothetical protein